jgi:spore cortex biosynthesis protein YabQ
MIAVSVGIFEELHNVSAAVLFGAALAAAYDVLRIFRRVIPRGVVCVSLEDILYWAAVCIGTFSFFFLVNSGELRAYLAAGIAVGAVLYHFLLGKWILAGISKLIGWIKKELKKLRKAVTMKPNGHKK